MLLKKDSIGDENISPESSTDSIQMPKNPVQLKSRAEFPSFDSESDTDTYSQITPVMYRLEETLEENKELKETLGKIQGDHYEEVKMKNIEL